MNSLKPKLMTLAILLAGILYTTGCDTTASVSDFSKSSEAALDSGNAILADLSATCGRRLANNQSFGGFATSDTLPPECQAIAKQANGIAAASAVVSEYFDALDSLASFNTATTATNAGKLASDASELAGLSADRASALSGLASFIAQITTSKYQAKHLSNDIVTVDPHLQKVLLCLEDAVNGPGLYADLLTDEDKSLANRSKEFLLQHPDSQSILMLDQRWKNEHGSLLARKQAAQAYVAALQQIGKGHAALAQQAKTATPKEVLAIAEPYVIQITSLIPTIKKAFN